MHSDVTKTFYASEFGNDVDRVHGVEPAKMLFAIKSQIRRAIEDEGISHTYVSSYCSFGRFLQTLAQLELESKAPPRDKVVILGDGNAKEYRVPLNMMLPIGHSVFVKGDQTNFEIDSSFCVEVLALCTDIKYIIIDEYLSCFV